MVQTNFPEDFFYIYVFVTIVSSQAWLLSSQIDYSRHFLATILYVWRRRLSGKPLRLLIILYDASLSTSKSSLRFM